MISCIDPQIGRSMFDRHWSLICFSPRWSTLKVSDRWSDWTKDNGARRCSRPSTINSTAAVDISPSRASHAIRYFNTRDEMLPSVVDSYPCRDAFLPSISSITDILDRSPHCRGHPHRESLVLLVYCVLLSSMIFTTVDSFVNALFLLIVNKNYLLSISSIFSYLMTKMITFLAWLSEIEEISWCTRILAKVSPRKARDLFECLVVSHRARPSWSSMMEAESSQLVTEEGTLLFSLVTRTNRARDE